MTLEEIVSAYIRDHRDKATRELRAFKSHPRRSLTDAIRQAALCKLPSGKRHPHQRRTPQDTLDEAERRLQRISDELEKAPDFASLHCVVEREIGEIPGIAALTVYDVTHRIGAFLGKAPALVYLHRGTKTKEGAASLGFKGKEIDPKVLPSAFQRLTAAEIEDCLCIYKDRLRIRAISTASCPTR